MTAEAPTHILFQAAVGVEHVIVKSAADLGSNQVTYILTITNSVRAIVIWTWIQCNKIANPMTIIWIIFKEFCGGLCVPIRIFLVWLKLLDVLTNFQNYLTFPDRKNLFNSFQCNWEDSKSTCEMVIDNIYVLSWIVYTFKNLFCIVPLDSLPMHLSPKLLP